MLQTNLTFLKNNRMDLFRMLSNLDGQSRREHLQIQRIGGPIPNVIFLTQPHPIYIHDPSDPTGQAEHVIRTTANQLSSHGHCVLFFGVGLGYHIRKFVEEYPHIPYSIYEPSSRVLAAFLAEVSLEDLNIDMLRHVFFGFDHSRTAAEIKSFVDQTPGGFTIITLPSYKQVFGQLTEEFFKVTQQIVDHKKKLRGINHHFEKKWVWNSFENFSYTMQSPSLFDYREHLRQKPVLLIAAGPSLQDEIETIREIKENRSAYIFTVGSAINTLVEYRIVPDAAFTYDPGDFNRHVFDRALQEKIDAFPLVYGTTVGSGTLASIPWPLIHMPISQDPVYDFYLRNEREGVVLQDAPSIAVIALQAFMKLECSPIILVGQNFAFREGQYYAKGVPHGFYDNKDRIPVQSVSGETIQTNYSLNTMRMEMEHYIRNNVAVKVINTTRDGARIEGAPFKPLAETICKLNSSGVVVPNWHAHPSKGESDNRLLLERKALMLNQFDQVKQLFSELDKSLHTIQVDHAASHFHRFDQLFKTLQRNLFFRSFLQPMNRVGYEVLYSKIVMVKTEVDLRKKSELVFALFGPFLKHCYADLVELTPKYEEINETIASIAHSRQGVEEA